MRHLGRAKSCVQSSQSAFSELVKKVVSYHFSAQVCLRVWHVYGVIMYVTHAGRVRLQNMTRAHVKNVM